MPPWTWQDSLNSWDARSQRSCKTLSSPIKNIPSFFSHIYFEDSRYSLTLCWQIKNTKSAKNSTLHINQNNGTTDPTQALGALKKHCQRHNGPEGWVLLTKVTSSGYITSSYTNLDQTSSEFRPTSKYQPNISISTKLAWISTSKSWPNLETLCSKSEQKLSSQICTKRSSSTSATVTTSTGFESASSHDRVTSIKFTKQQWVSESVIEWVSLSVSHWQTLPMMGLRSDKKFFWAYPLKKSSILFNSSWVTHFWRLIAFNFDLKRQLHRCLVSRSGNSRKHVTEAAGRVWAAGTSCCRLLLLHPPSGGTIQPTGGD